jgi:hypothetical protein
VAEAAAIPVKHGSLDGVTVTPFKAGAIVVATSELMARGRFAEQYVHDSLRSDLSLGVDGVFLSNDAATTAAPAGIFHTSNGAAAIAATSGANALAAATDIANLLATSASMTRPTLLINPASAAKALRLAGASDYPLLTGLANGRVLNAAVLFAGNLSTTTIALIDADGLLAAGGDDFEIAVSTGAALHMDDAPNADVLVPESGGRSMFQRDSVAVRVMLPVTWRSKRTSAVQHVASVTW